MVSINVTTYTLFKGKPKNGPAQEMWIHKSFAIAGPVPGATTTPPAIPSPNLVRAAMVQVYRHPKYKSRQPKHEFRHPNTSSDT